MSINRLKRITIKKVIKYISDKFELYKFNKNNKLLYAFDKKNNRYQFGYYYKKSLVNPKSLHVSLSDACNLRCRFCIYHGENSDFINHKNIMRADVVSAIRHNLVKNKNINKLLLVGNGEPFMNPKWFEYTQQLIKGSFINEITLYTNGMLLNQRNIEKLMMLSTQCTLTLVVSIGGGSPRASNHYRLGGDYETIKQNLLNTMAQVPLADVVISAACILPGDKNYNTYDDAFTAITEGSSFLQKDFPSATVATYPIFPYVPIEGTKTVMFDRLFKIFCPTFFDTICIKANGNIISCACRYEEEVLGNVLCDDMFEIFNNNIILKNNRKLLQKNKYPSLCETCEQRPGKNTQSMLQEIY